MSNVDKLHILGIRSFGPEDKDKAVVKFSSPLTLILGQNGCGKTTIIEALKYATCGDLPGGVDSGSGFVHDPELANANIVRGHVKLRFSDIRGKSHTVARTVQVTKKIKKLEFKSVDSTITGDDKTSISGRCADIDAVVCNSLGVSKSVLTNVIFCHQEDSAWPLEKGKKIKEKFDAIFGITEYNKCLEQIRSLDKELQHRKNVLEAEVRGKEQNWEEAREKRAKLENTRTLLAASRDKVAAIRNDIEPIDAQLREIERKLDNYVDHMSRVRDKKNRKERIEEEIDELKREVQQEFRGTKEELIIEIETFEQELRNQQKELSALGEEKKNVENEEKRLSSDTNVKQIFLGKLQNLDEQNNNRVESRNFSLNSLAEELELPTCTSSQLNETNGDASLKSIESRVNEYNRDYEKLLSSQESMERSLQHKIDSAREKKARLETDAKLKEKSMADIKKEASKINIELAEVDNSTSTLGELEENLRAVDSEIRSLRDSFNADEMKDKTREKMNSIKDLEDKMSSLDEEIKSLQEVSVDRYNLDELVERKRNRESEFSSLKDKNAEYFKQLISKVPTDNFKAAVEARVERLTEEIKRTENVINGHEKKLSVLNEKKRFNEEQLRKKIRQISEDGDKIEELCGKCDISAYLSDIAAKIEESQDLKGTLSSSEFLFQRYVDKLKSEDPLCPLCKREFNDTVEIQSVIEDLNKRLKEIPSRLESVKSQLESLQLSQSTAQQLKPIYDGIESARTREIPRLKEEIKNIDSEIQSVERQLEISKNALKSPQRDECTAKSVLPDATVMDQHRTEIQILENKIRHMESKLSKFEFKKTLKDANEEKDALRCKLKEYKETLEEGRQKITTYNEKLTKLNEKKSSLTARQLQIAGSVQKRKNLTGRLSELNTTESSLSVELQQVKDQIDPVFVEMTENTRKLCEMRNMNKRLLQEKKKKINEYERKVDDIKKLQAAIVEYERKGGNGRLQTTRDELSQMKLKMNDLLSRKSNCEKKIADINNSTAMEKIKKIDLDHNLKLICKKEDFRKVVGEINALEGETPSVNADQLRREQTLLAEKRKNLENQKSFAEGGQAEQQRSIGELEKELKKNLYRDAEKEYRNCSVKHEVIRKAMEDLKEYAKGMEWVMIHFHQDRMRMINAIVRELWRSIYRGNDIDWIEIKTDESASTSTSARKNYNYKVVQVKSGVELDMPGRCSAGQKVLACLIIRMALAETFSKNCGILALDEPTTNLDKDNVDSLSAALAEIVERRSAQKNFQLIVITHDEEFLKKLFRVGKLENYLEVKRDYRGKSVVFKREV